MSANNHFNYERQKLVSELKKEGIKEKAVLNAISKVPRHNFVPMTQKEYAYINSALPIECQQTISQPYIVAFMTEAAQINPNSKVLEIGTGSGYQAAILAEISKEVFTIEIKETLANKAHTLLKKLGYRNIHFKIGNGYFGWQNEAPFDAILVTAACKTLPKNLIQQLSIGGHLIIPRVYSYSHQVLTR
ncbi:MAG: Protein-L-isoaspartate O-methyltransferase [Legionellaceae bacterium]